MLQIRYYAIPMISSAHHVIKTWVRMAMGFECGYLAEDVLVGLRGAELAETIV